VIPASTISILRVCIEFGKGKKTDYWTTPTNTTITAFSWIPWISTARLNNPKLTTVATSVAPVHRNQISHLVFLVSTKQKGGKSGNRYISFL